MPPTPATNSGTEDIISPSATMSPSHNVATQGVHTTQHEEVMSDLRQLEEEFFELVNFVEDSLRSNETCLETILRRFRMLPQSVRRQHQTDENYKATRRRVLNSTTIKELFDNLTDLKHWNFMTPDTLTHILQDVQLDDVQLKVGRYMSKLTAFKAKTKLRDMIGLRFPVPDYCIELTMTVEGWEEKTIDDAEKAVMNILHRATYGSHDLHLRWKAVLPGSIELVFIFTDSTDLEEYSLYGIKGILYSLSETFKHDRVVRIQVDGDNVYSTMTLSQRVAAEVPSSRLWYTTGTTGYTAGGGRDVLIISSHFSLPDPEAVARRSGRLTEEDKQKLQNQGVPHDCKDELAIVMERYKLDKECRVVGVKSDKSLSQLEVMKNIEHLLTSSQCDGAIIYYFGAGRRNTGDWCFEDGFITFRDIAEIYLRANSNEEHDHVLTIISDCSYSGCWVRDCMEFLDELGVQPCGHKAREKGMLIKVYTSCRSTEIPTEYHYSVSGADNDKITGMLSYYLQKQLLETQTTDGIDSSNLLCDSKTIDDPCTLRPHYTWKKLRESERLHLVHGKKQGEHAWYYVLLEDDEDTVRRFHEELKSGNVNNIAIYGRILTSGSGRDPPKETRDRINQEYDPQHIKH